MTPPPLATVADVQLLFGPFADEEVDKLGQLLAVASAAVRAFCRQTLSRVTDDEVTIVSSGTTFLTLGQRPVVDVSEVEVMASGPWFFEPGSWPAAGRFTWDAFGHLHRVDGLTWGLRYDPVRVVYSHGFDPVPPDLVGLVAAKVANSVAASAANPGGLRSLQVGAMSETYSNSAGSAAALGAATLTEAEQDALRSAGYRQGAISVPIGAR